MATSEDDEGFSAFLAFLQSDTDPTAGKDDKNDEKPNNSSTDTGDKMEKDNQPEVEKEQQPEKVLERREAPASTPPGNDNAKEQPPTKDNTKGDDKGFLDFLSFVYDVPLEPEQPKKENPKDTQQQTREQLQKEETDAWIPIDTHTKSSEKQESGDGNIVTTSKRIMKEIIENEEDPSRQKTKFILMELDMLFSLAGADAETGGAKVANIFRYLKDDAAKSRVPSG